MQAGRKTRKAGLLCGVVQHDGPFDATRMIYTYCLEYRFKVLMGILFCSRTHSTPFLLLLQMHVVTAGEITSVLLTHRIERHHDCATHTGCRGLGVGLGPEPNSNQGTPTQKSDDFSACSHLPSSGMAYYKPVPIVP